MFRHKRIAIDFDGTLFEDVPSIDKCFEDNTSLIPKEGAAEVTRWLLAEKFFGFDTYIHRPTITAIILRPRWRLPRSRMTTFYFIQSHVLIFTSTTKAFDLPTGPATRTFIETHLYQAENSNAVDQSPDTGFEQHLRDTRLAKATASFAVLTFISAVTGLDQPSRFLT